MKRVSVLHSIISVAMRVICVVNPIGSSCMVNERSIISAEYMSLKELVAIVHGIKIIDGEVVAIMIITSSMIYLVNAYQLHNNNTMTKI